MELSLWCFCKEKYFTLGRTHNQLTCVPAFWERKNERGILVLSFVLWYFYKFKTMSFSCHNSLKSKLTWMWHYENTFLTKSALKEWTHVHTLLCMHLKWKLLPECLNSTVSSWKDWGWSFMCFSGKWLRRRSNTASATTHHTPKRHTLSIHNM